MVASALTPWRYNGLEKERGIVAVEQQRLNERANQLYEQYAMPLEAEHTGKYVAISPSGQVVLGDTMLEVAQKANEAFGSGNFVFKLGQRAVGRWR